MNGIKLRTVNELYYDYEMISRRKEIMVESIPFLKYIAISMFNSFNQEETSMRRLRKKIIV